MTTTLRLHQVLALAGVSLFLLGCPTQGQVIETRRYEWPLANFRAEATGKRGIPVPITVHLIAGGCAEPDWVKAEVDDENRIVTLSGATKWDVKYGMLCPGIMHYPPVSTSFTPQDTGTYTLKGRIRPDRATESNTGGYAHLSSKLEFDVRMSDDGIEASQAVLVSE